MPLIRCTNVFYQRKISSHITSPSANFGLGTTWDKATPVWQLLFFQRCRQLYHAAEPSHRYLVSGKTGWFYALYTKRLLSRIVRKPDFCPCENKGADQLRSNCEADQRLCFRHSDSTIPLLLVAKISSI